uniref:HTH_48 domain-containing protein n=1 Tax=Heterorhabditis bacteriophora TaxID=37862 RepID=A0A1I7WEI3_HETBA
MLKIKKVLCNYKQFTRICRHLFVNVSSRWFK